jgi:hypothetical protein
MKTVDKLPLEEVVWEDHFSSTDWASQEDMIKDDESIYVTSVGYRLKETKHKIVLVQNVATNGHVSGTMTILKRTVSKRTLLREVQ